MTTELREALRSLAGHAPSATPADPEDLWSRGRHRQVRRAAAGAAIGTVVAVVLGLGGMRIWSWVEGRDPDPAHRPASELVLPDHVFTPGQWLEGTDEAGPTGPLVAVIGAARSEWQGWRVDTVNGLAGISTTGQYRFLDLPGWTGQVDYAGNGEVALSPDGRYLAYWATGPTTGEPSLRDPGEPVLGGVAVYDSVTGSVDRKYISSPHGLSNEGVAWAGDVVRFTYGAYLPPGSEFGGRGARIAGHATWRAPHGGWTLTTAPDRILQASQQGQGAGSFTVYDGRWLLVGPAGVERGFRLATPVEGSLVPSPDGRRVVGILDPTPRVADGGANAIVVSDLDRLTTAGRSVGTVVPGSEARVVYGWRDDTHVVAEGLAKPGIYSVDVTTGESTLLVTRVGQNHFPGLIVAADSWRAKQLTAAEPRWPWDPRLKLAVITGSLLAGWGLWRAWRRRRGPR